MADQSSFRIIRIPYSHYEVHGNGQVWVMFAESRQNWTVYNQHDRTKVHHGVRGYRAALNLVLSEIRETRTDA
jgi:hypothetical protein